MAVTGVHFECSHGGPPGVAGASLPVPRHVLWSENPATGVATSNIVPAQDPSLGRAVVTAAALSDCWVAEAVPPASPAPGANPRRLVPAGARVDWTPQAGAVLAWTAA